MDIDQQAIADHGWGPLNCKFLKHPSLCHQEDTFFHSAHKLSCQNIENSGGERIKNKSAKQAAERRLADGNNIWKHIKDAKQVSSGVLAKHGVFALDSAEFIAGLKQCHDNKKAIKTEKAKKT